MALARYVIGTLCLIIGCVFVAMSAPAAVGAILHPAQISVAFTLTLLLVGLLFIFMAGYFWVRTVKLTPGDHILSDRGGLLVSLMLVTMLKPDSWRGAYEGMLDGSRR